MFRSARPSFPRARTGHASLLALVLAVPALGVPSSATADEGFEDADCHRSSVEVACTVESPKVLVGDPFTASATVTNTGTRPISDLTVLIGGREGVTAIGEGPLRETIPLLEVGATHTLEAVFTSESVGTRGVAASARDEKAWVAAWCQCSVEVEGLPALQVEMIDLNRAREPEGIFEVGQEFLYELEVMNDMGTAGTPDLRVLWSLPPELEFVSGTGDRGVEVTGAGQSLESGAFSLAPDEIQRFEVLVKVIGVPAKHLVQTRASVQTAGGTELAQESESTTLRPATGR